MNGRSSRERTNFGSMLGLGIVGGLVGGAVLVGAGLLLAPDLFDGDSTPSQPPTAAAEECPHDWGSDWWGADQQSATVDFTGGRDDIPEYNDCQRFFVGSPADPKYSDHPYAVFAADYVADGNMPGPAAPAALVWAGGAYVPLGLTGKGFFCLTLTPRQGMNALMTAATINKQGAWDCEEQGKALWVHVRPSGPTTTPSVVRWGFDGYPLRDKVPDQAKGGSPKSHWVQYAILPCGQSVCYVGPTDGSGPGFQVLPPAAILAAISNGGLGTGDPVYTVDGWHDTQVLADPGASSPSPSAGLLVGSLIPEPGLDSLTRDDFKSDWQPVARVAMSGAAYEAKLNFGATTGSEYNRIEACVYVADDPAGATGNCTGVDPNLACDDDDGYRWRTRHFNVADGTWKYYCVELKPFGQNANLVVPGTTRWKWDQGDEKAWFRCPDGCCLVQP